MHHRAARTEVTSKSDVVIERETAEKWAARSIACFEKYAETGNQKWLVRAEDYKHEALEHAALVGDFGRTVCRVQKMIEGRR